MTTKMYLLTLMLSMMLTSCEFAEKPHPTADAFMPTQTTVPSTPALMSTPEPKNVYLADLTPVSTSVGYWQFTSGVYPGTDSGMVEGAPIKMLDIEYPKGLFAHAPSQLTYLLDTKYETLSAELFILPGCSDGATFQVALDGDIFFEKEILPGQPPAHIEVSILRGEKLQLYTDPGEQNKNECDWTVWGNAELTALDDEQKILLPQKLLEAQSLPMWVNDFVYAYGGWITVNGVEMDAVQLIDEIQANPESFVEARQVGEDPYLFFVVNGVPLAMQGGDGKWREATLARLSELSGVIFEFSRSGTPDDRQDDYARVLEKVAGRGSNFTFPGEMDTCRIFNEFSKDDWNKVIANWDEIKQGLDKGEVPAGFPYQWQGAYDLIDYVKTHVTEPQFRGQHLVEARLSEYCLLSGSIIRTYEEQGFGNEDMLKILEFVVRTRVIKFSEVTKWDVQDEMIATYLEGVVGEDPSKRFWNNATGLNPAEITAQVADWVKQDHPQAKTYIVEDVIFEDKYDWAQANIVEFDKYIQTLHDSDAKVDGIISENNFWIFAPPDMGYISQKIDEFNTLGYEIGGAETMIITGDDMINDPRRPRLTQVSDRNLAQAELYQDLLNLYLSKGIRNFGFGGIDDYNAWTNDVGLPDADPLLFDDDFHAKPSYYAILQVLFEHLP